MDFYSVTQWIYPIFDFTIMVLCFTLLRGSSRIMLGVAFLILLLSSLSWPIFDLLNKFYPDSEVDSLYNIGSIVAFVTYLISSILIIFAIINLSATLRAVSETGQRSMPTDEVSSFGNIQFYLIPYIIGIGVMSVGVVIILDSNNIETAIVITLLGLIIISGSSIYLLIIIYRLWAFIINESSLLGLTPAIRSAGQAVGFLFIPLFNFYWLFLVYGKMAKNINAIARQSGATQLMPEGLGNTIPILTVFTIIPYLGSLISLILGATLVPIFISRAIRMSTSLRQSR